MTIGVTMGISDRQLTNDNALTTSAVLLGLRGSTFRSISRRRDDSGTEEEHGVDKAAAGWSAFVEQECAAFKADIERLSQDVPLLLLVLFLVTHISRCHGWQGVVLVVLYENQPMGSERHGSPFPLKKRKVKQKSSPSAVASPSQANMHLMPANSIPSNIPRTEYGRDALQSSQPCQPV